MASPTGSLKDPQEAFCSTSFLYCTQIDACGAFGANTRGCSVSPRRQEDDRPGPASSLLVLLEIRHRPVLPTLWAVQSVCHGQDPEAGAASVYEGRRPHGPSRAGSHWTSHFCQRIDVYLHCDVQFHEVRRGVAYSRQESHHSRQGAYGTRWTSVTKLDFAIARSRVRLPLAAAVYQRLLSVPSLRGRLMSSCLRVTG